MKIRLYIENKKLTLNEIISLDKNQSHYLKNVLRSTTGTIIYLFDNKTGEYEAKIIEISRICQVKIIKQTKSYSKPSPITLWFAPVKNAKAEWIATKATELGITSIQPIITERTIVKKVNTSRMQANVIEASEQCERIDIPEIKEIAKLSNLLEKLNKDDTLIFCDETGSGLSPKELFKNPLNNIHILIGPEGGFSKKENETIKQYQNTQTLSLGSNILKADTAIIAALSLTRFLY